MSIIQVPIDICIDCDAGRDMGCDTFCCRLLVRLKPEDAEALYPENPSKRFIDKDSDGYCMYLDRDTHRCDIWENRPSICREYNCNTDFMLQVAIHQGYDSLVDLAKKSVKAYLPKEIWVSVPELDEDS